MIAITTELAQALLDYLAEKPFKEVAPLVNGLLEGRPVQLAEPDEGAPSDEG